MKKLDDTIKRLKAFDPQEVVAQVVADNDDVIVEMNTDDQLFARGVNRNNVAIADYAPYAGQTILFKELKNQPTDRVTLRDSGDFHNSFYIELLGDGFEIKAVDEKTEELEMKYGEEIFGLADFSVFNFAHNYIKPEMIKALRTP